MRSLSCLLACACLITTGLFAPCQGVSASRSIDRVIDNYEDDLQSAFRGLRGKIDRYLSSHRRQALGKLEARLKASSGDDQIFLAYHILSHDPDHDEAHEVFERQGLTPPVTADGVHQAGSPIPVPANKALIGLTTGIAHPPLAEVRSFLVDNAQHWAKRQRKYATETLMDLLELHREGHASLVNPVLAIYFPYSPQVQRLYPPAKEVDRAWLNPFDRYLLDHGLAGVDAASYKPRSGKAPRSVGDDIVMSGRASWRFPIPLRTVKLEVDGITGGSGTLRVSNQHGDGLAMLLGSEQIKVMQGNKELISTPVPDGSRQRGLSLACDIQGTQGLLVVDGQPVAQFPIPKQYAYVEFQAEGSKLRCHGLVCRYVGDAAWAEHGAAIAKADTGSKGPAETPAKPQRPSWQDDRDAELAKTLSFSFSETALREVVDNLATLSGISISLDSSAADLADLPVNLAGEDMAFSDVLKWLKRTADLDYRTTATGFELYWGS